jgi:hypothetical protein
VKKSLFIKKLFLFSSLAIAACKKTDDSGGLPGPSSNGQNYLACKVNGVIHTYSASDGLGRNGVVYNRFINKTGIGASEAKYNDDIGFMLPIVADSVNNNNYILNSEADDFFGHYTKHQSGGKASDYYITSSSSGWVRFSRIDTAVAAGTFAFIAYRNGQKGADSVVITDGRFDIAW